MTGAQARLKTPRPWIALRISCALAWSSTLEPKKRTTWRLMSVHIPLRMANEREVPLAVPCLYSRALPRSTFEYVPIQFQCNFPVLIRNFHHRCYRTSADGLFFSVLCYFILVRFGTTQKPERKCELPRNVFKSRVRSPTSFAIVNLIWSKMWVEIQNGRRYVYIRAQIQY
ncbi:hypothetical protein DFH09DRAFT_143591 [Mycena vulgaris]|nr:hypothetical protein DFH09DRAFT_143591 [Mycena vulgaris]